MKILSIGNSFSQDAHRYLHEIAKHNGEELKTVNLYIGSCFLRKHYLNMLENSKAYSFEFNGKGTGIFVSIKEALMSDDWDYVTLQQASRFSGEFDSYTPYIEKLAEYVRTYCPKAKLLLHETWTYENGAKSITNAGYTSYDDMYFSLKAAYERAAKLISADGIIPSGTAMRLAAERGIKTHADDKIHASRGAGRYLLALVWFKFLFNKDITRDSFDNFDVDVTLNERNEIISVVNSVFK